GGEHPGTPSRDGRLLRGKGAGARKRNASTRYEARIHLESGELCERWPIPGVGEGSTDTRAETAVPRGQKPRRSRERVQDATSWARRRSHCRSRSRVPHESQADHTLGGASARSYRVWYARVCRRRRLDLIRAKSQRSLRAGWSTRRQDPSRYETCGSTRRAANDVRADRQPEDG